MKSEPRQQWTEANAHPESERLLWCAVIWETLDCAMTPIAKLIERNKSWDRLKVNEVRECRAWFGSRSFKEVCCLAGYEPDYILKRVKPLIAQAVSNDTPGEGSNFPEASRDRRGPHAQNCV